MQENFGLKFLLRKQKRGMLILHGNDFFFIFSCFQLYFRIFSRVLAKMHRKNASQKLWVTDARSLREC